MGQCFGRMAAGTDSGEGKMLSVDFEVFGKVQGVYFRKNTKETAARLGLVGWVQNTRTNTVIGTAQGPASTVAQLKNWLQTKGSPMSRIDRCDFKNERELSSLSFESFEVKK